MIDEAGFWDLLARQFGLITVRQASAFGMTRDRIATLVKRGSLRRVTYGLLGAAGVPKSRERDLMLGILLASNRSGGGEVTAALCGPTAGFRWGLLEKDEELIHVVSTRKMKTRAGYRFHWTTRLSAKEVLDLHGLLLTDPIRTYLDLCRSHKGLAVYIYKRGLRKGLFTEASVAERIDEESRQGRGGLCVGRMILEETDPSAARAKSAREDHYFELLVELGYPPPERNFKVQSSFGYMWEIDLYYPQAAKGFDVSPYDTHMDPKVNTRDARKALDLRTRGIELFTITDGISDAEFKRQVLRILGSPERFPRRGEEREEVG